jgi:hypothetical protein
MNYLLKREDKRAHSGDSRFHYGPLGNKSRNGGNQAHRLTAGYAAAMAKQAEAERERRAKIIHADGEFQSSQKLADAASVIANQPMQSTCGFGKASWRSRQKKSHHRSAGSGRSNQ